MASGLLRGLYVVPSSCEVLTIDNLFCEWHGMAWLRARIVTLDTFDFFLVTLLLYYVLRCCSTNMLPSVTLFFNQPLTITTLPPPSNKLLQNPVNGR